VKILNCLGKMLDRINKIVEYISFSMLVVMVIVVFLQVIFRFIIKQAIPWSEELARYLLVWISLLGTSIGVKKKAHIGVEAVVKMLPGKFQKAVSLLANALSMVFFVIIVIWGYKILGVVSVQRSPAMEISMAIPYSALFFSGILMLVYSLYNFLSTIKSLKEGI